MNVRFSTSCAVLAGALLTSGCEDTSQVKLRAPSDVPKFAIDVAASELHVVGPLYAEALKEAGAEALAEMAQLAGDGRGVPARFNATLHADKEIDGPGLACFILVTPLLLGLDTALWAACQTTNFVAVVDLRLETPNGTFEGHGEAKKGACWLCGLLSWPAAVHDAFQKALANAKPVGPSPSGQVWTRDRSSL